MKFFSPLFVVFAIVLYVAAAPSQLEVRDSNSTTVMYCEQKNLRPPCKTTDTGASTCTNVDGDFFNAGILSFLPAGTPCTLYTGSGCTGNTRTAGPGPVLDLSDFKLQSFSCVGYDWYREWWDLVRAFLRAAAGKD